MSKATRVIDTVHGVDAETILRRAIGELLAVEAETECKTKKVDDWNGTRVEVYYRMTDDARERLIELRLSLERHLL